MVIFSKKVIEKSQKNDRIGNLSFGKSVDKLFLNFYYYKNNLLKFQDS